MMMNARLTLMHAYDHLARNSHQWPAKARMCAMVTLWNAANLVQEEDTMPGTPWKLDTQEKLHDAGYRYEDQGACADPSCKATVLWFITPKEHWMPFEQVEVPDPLNPNSDQATKTIYQPHFVSCQGARNFSRKSKDVIEKRTA